MMTNDFLYQKMPKYIPIFPILVIVFRVSLRTLFDVKTVPPTVSETKCPSFNKLSVRIKVVLGLPNSFSNS